jgi:hypothetical protein
MKRISEYIVLALFVCVLLLPSCRRVRIIGERDMSDIYAEMFLADQWLNDNPSVKTTADTTRFYETIFRKYGYGFENYDASVNYYLYRPEKFKKILERAEKKLRATQSSLEAFEASLEKQNKILEGLGFLHLPVFSADSVKVDTSMLWAPWRDTLSARDSALRDTTAKKDTTDTTICSAKIQSLDPSSAAGLEARSESISFRKKERSAISTASIVSADGIKMEKPTK